LKPIIPTFKGSFAWHKTGVVDAGVVEKCSVKIWTYMAKYIAIFASDIHPVRTGADEMSD
jgi:hypothetical protein